MGKHTQWRQKNEQLRDCGKSIILLLPRAQCAYHELTHSHAALITMNQTNPAL